MSAGCRQQRPFGSGLLGQGMFAPRSERTGAADVTPFDRLPDVAELVAGRDNSVEGND